MGESEKLFHMRKILHEASRKNVKQVSVEGHNKIFTLSIPHHTKMAPQAATWYPEERCDLPNIKQTSNSYPNQQFSDPDTATTVFEEGHILLRQGVIFAVPIYPPTVPKNGHKKYMRVILNVYLASTQIHFHL